MPAQAVQNAMAYPAELCQELSQDSPFDQEGNWRAIANDQSRLRLDPDEKLRRTASHRTRAIAVSSIQVS